MELFAGRAVFTDFRFLLLGHVVVIMILFVGPLVVFSTKLFEVKTKGVLEYGNLAHEYVWLFHRKWIKREAAESEAIIGSADIQSLADLGNSFEVVRTMRMAPLDYMTTILPLLLATLAPFAPWIAILVPLDKLAGDPVDIFVNGRMVARGEVLVLNDNFCVRVAEILTPEM